MTHDFLNSVESSGNGVDGESVKESFVHTILAWDDLLVQIGLVEISKGGFLGVLQEQWVEETSLGLVNGLGSDACCEEGDSNLEFKIK